MTWEFEDFEDEEIEKYRDDYIPLASLPGTYRSEEPIQVCSRVISVLSCDVPICDIGRINVESDFVESLINRDTSIVYSSKIDPILEEFAGELAHIAPIPPGIVEADPDDDTSSDDDHFEDVEYVSLEECECKRKEFGLRRYFSIQDGYSSREIY
ncbi:hypothetical protein Tco_0063986 [Tanacetum coccineum]